MTNCRFCRSSNLRTLVSYPDYPIFIGCSDRPRTEDELYEFSLFLCHDCGVIQQTHLPPLEILYREPRFFGRGRMWQGHYDAYHDFISTGIKDGASTLEIGGGPGLMLRRLRDSNRRLRLFDVEPHPIYDFPDVTTFRCYFDRDFETEQRFDAIYSSHLIEHLSDIHVFFSRARDLLKEGGSLFTACPNISESFKRRHLNAFTTDHFNYFSPLVLERLAAQHGFAVRRSSMYLDHGMYFHFGLTANEVPPPDGRLAAAQIEHEFDTYIDTVNRFAASVTAPTHGSAFLYGAHAFTITFLRHLSRDLRFRAVLDNEPTKQNRRLCGTELVCRSPEMLREERDPTVVIYMGAYTNEIVAQLQTINPAVRLVRLDEFGKTLAC
jgi:SAM-dependent methyltransferase